MSELSIPNDTAPGARACGRFAGAPIEIPVAPLLRLQGYRELDRVRPRVRALATAAAAQTAELMAPETRFRRLGVASCSGTGVTLADGTRFHGSEFAKVLDGCAEVVVFVLTLGAALDEETLRRTDGEEIVEALFLETAGWIAVEKATQAFARHLLDGLRPQGLALTRRLGPGYADWPLDEQAALFALLAGAPLPVRLLDSGAMLPKKSRSGLYGLRPLA